MDEPAHPDESRGGAGHARDRDRGRHGPRAPGARADLPRAGGTARGAVGGVPRRDAARPGRTASEPAGGESHHRPAALADRDDAAIHGGGPARPQRLAGDEAAGLVKEQDWPEEIEAALPGLIRTAFSTYRESGDIAEARAALAHLHGLLRLRPLVRAASGLDRSRPAAPDLAALLAHAPPELE